MTNFIDISKAARLLGVTCRAIRKRCMSGDLPGAVKDGSSWKIPIDADPRFRSAGVVGTRIDPAAMAAVPKPKLDAAIRRAGLIAQFEKFSAAHVRAGGYRSDAMTIFCSREKIALATFKRWLKQYRVAGVAGLVDERKGRSREVISPDAWEFFKALYLDPRQPSIRQCIRMISTMNRTEKKGWGLPSYTSLCRYIDKNLPLPARVLHREGEGAYDARCAPYLQPDLSEVDPGSFFIGDHHQFNVLIRHSGKWVRPWLTGWLDMRSRALVGWVVCIYPNQVTILQSFKKAAEKYGPPASVKIDNGRDYDSQLFTGTTKQRRRRCIKKGYLCQDTLSGLYGLLDIDVSFSKPYHPQSKAIERFFDTLDRQFCKFFTTYCGKDSSRKPEELNDYLASETAIEEANDLKTFTSLFDAWADTYNTRPHSSLAGETPLEVLNRRESKRVPLNGVLDLLCRVWSPVLTVGKNGVRFNNIFYGQFDPVLMQHQGKQVRVSYDPDNVSEIFVYTADTWRLITKAEGNQVVPYGSGIADSDMREALRQKNRALRIVKQSREAARIKHIDVQRLAAASLADETRSAPMPTSAPKVQIIKSVMDTQVQEHKKVGAKKILKKAVGSPVVLDWDFEPEPVRQPQVLEWD